MSAAASKLNPNHGQRGAMREERFVVAHPESQMGNYEWAWRAGWRLLAIRPNGLLVYQRRGWLARLCGF